MQLCILLIIDLIWTILPKWPNIPHTLQVPKYGAAH